VGKVRDFLNAKVGGEREQRIGIAGFTMLARIRDTYNYTSEVPTTYLEDGSSVEDTIVLNPTRLSIEGLVADVFVEQDALQEAVEAQSTTIGQISIYAPERTQSQRQTVASIVADVGDAIDAADELIDAGGQVSQLFGSAGTEGKTLRERFVDTMESLHFGRQLVSIEMPYRTFDNMRINVEIETDNRDEAIRFKIDAAEVRTADEAVSEVSGLLSNPSPGLGGQAESVTDKGVQQGEEVETSLLGTITGLLGG
jgi:hypothetical protein